MAPKGSVPLAGFARFMSHQNLSQKICGMIKPSSKLPEIRNKISSWKMIKKKIVSCFVSGSTYFLKKKPVSRRFVLGTVIFCAREPGAKPPHFPSAPFFAIENGCERIDSEPVAVALPLCALFDKNQTGLFFCSMDASLEMSCKNLPPKNRL